MNNKCKCGKEGFFYRFNPEQKKLFWQCKDCILKDYPVMQNSGVPKNVDCVQKISMKIGFSILTDYFRTAIDKVYFNEEKEVLIDPNLVAISINNHYLADGSGDDGRCSVCNYITECIENNHGKEYIDYYCPFKDPKHPLYHYVKGGPVRGHKQPDIPKDKRKEKVQQICEKCEKRAFYGASYCPNCGNEFSIHTDINEEKLSDKTICGYCNETISGKDKFCRCCGGKIDKDKIKPKKNIGPDFYEEII